MNKAVLAHILLLLNLALLAGLLLSPAPSGTPVTLEYETISVPKAGQALIDQKALFIDARSTEAYQEQSIPTAQSWPAGEKPSPQLLEAMRRAEQIVVYCDGPHCGAGAQVAKDILSMDFDNVVLMEAGIEGWLKAGNPVSRYPSVSGASETK